MLGTRGSGLTAQMTDLELQQLRREKWRLDGKAIRTIEQARAFLEDVGFCLMYPKRPALLVPTFIGAFVGSEDRLPGWQHAFKDPRAAEATELMVRLLRERTAFEANLFDENNGFLVEASVFPYFYALVGERNPKLAPKAGSRSAYSALACDAFELIQSRWSDLEAEIAGGAGRERVAGGTRWRAGRVVVEAADYARGLQGERRVGVGRAIPVGSGSREGGCGTFGAGGPYGAIVKISRLRRRSGAGGPGSLFWKRSGTVEGAGRGKCAAGCAGVELRACERAIDAADHAGEGCGAAGCAACGAVSVLFRNTTTGAEARFNSGRFSRRSKRRSSTVVHVFGTPDISTSFLPHHQNYARDI